MSEYNASELIKQFNEEKTQAGANAKCEIEVMRAMLNDPGYKVDVYGKNGVEGQYCPREDAVSIVTNVLKNTAKLAPGEAVELANSHTFGKSDAAAAVNISKEFINSYLQTGRKLPLGPREKSNISLKLKTKEETVSSFPRKTGVDENGKPIYERTTGDRIPSYNTISVSSTCPPWLKG